MKSTNRALLPWILANVLIVVGFWLTGIEIGSWSVGGRWVWGRFLGWVCIIVAAVLMWVQIFRAEYRKRH